MPFASIAAYAPPRVGMLAVGLVAEVFDAHADGPPRFDFALCTERPGQVTTDVGVPLAVEHGLERLAAADLVLVLPWADFRIPPPEPVLDALRAAHARGALVGAHCVGAFALAAAGLLDGLRATTHWRFADLLARRHPSVTVDPDALYVDEGRILTGAGAAAGFDLCLHLLRREYGAAAANAVARDLVLPPHRDGGQAQYLASPVPEDGEDERLADVLAWAREHLHEPLPVAELARRALMSRRSFARRFTAATGTTPHAWVVGLRLGRAEELLETTDLPVEEIARLVGYGSAAVLREQFVRRRGVPPRTYRRAFTRMR
ncbi:AraC family transcriptional regulator [Streptomyces agglomeratus]|uniref:AraC family transcriptional regulator n=1 Tax=Streptomyces agglomeratus TaxID=285458 RepID=A0A1E5P223_9ACTN|nr:helix-turn-helix domain-containing protein [Streptomyces agglomeratus]OEJ23608.1 AraC family transcriptional regulator [Streptomyces agglomeratus]OEJ43202.1 AraC family transcriptional regulator [Streptomyces agglomeratus]OEJ54876.1 AraC family transcriptional regulator [Streptomyces agglomeratus]